MKYIIVLTFFIRLLCPEAFSQTEYFVSPSGNDRNSGSKHKPFRTIQQAQKEVRKIIAGSPTGDITVWLAGGTYQLSESLKFGKEDAVKGSVKVNYRAIATEKPVVSGGVAIKNWKKNREGLWVATVPQTIVSPFRELFIDGQRAQRARHPNTSFLRIAAVGADHRTGFQFNNGDFPILSDSHQVELILLHDWSVSRVPVDRIDYAENKIIKYDSIGAKCLDFFTLDHWEKNPRYYLENAFAFLDTANEWFFDAEKALLFLILPEGKDPNHCNIVAPVIGPHLMEITGEEGHYIRNIVFEGIGFQYCSWILPERGYAGIQACHFDSQYGKEGWHVVPAAVNVKMAENCRFISCDFQHFGGTGLWFGSGCRRCSVSDSRFEDISGNGIMIGEGSDRMINGNVWWKVVPEQAATGNIISGNIVTECGKQFYGAVGIWSGLTAETLISKNHIFNLPYSGISVGWEWSPAPTPCRANQINGNHIHHIMELLSDGGGIYMLGLQPRSAITGNIIHDVRINVGRAESNGMFLDEGTTDLIVSENIIYNIARSPLRFHQATVNYVRENILSCAGDVPPVRYNSTSYSDIRLENNLILMDMDTGHKKLLEEKLKGWNDKHDRTW